MQKTLLRLATTCTFLGCLVFLPACLGLDEKNGSECSVSNKVFSDPGCSDELPCPGSIPCLEGKCLLKLHGETCQSNDECRYGLCHSSPEIAAFKFCTKRCDCGKNSQCSDDDGNGKYYTCQRFSSNTHPNEELLSICSRTCVATKDCPGEYNGCEIVTGARKVCVQN